MTNPYQSPHSDDCGVQSHQVHVAAHELARSAVRGPAIGLLVVSIISVAALVLTLPFDVLLLIVGIREGRVGAEEFDDVMAMVLRLIWWFAILAASAYCIYGAWQMKSLKNFAQARTAAVVAVIPCLGPCCLLGIPFGAWALAVLARPEVQCQFET